ncbi:hypothetical protein GCM10010336_12580 [Streptomyces goshikiensis]|nr:hypothetical protein GCM10010336_12580 [Streptomyces goshikiensis]
MPARSRKRLSWRPKTRSIPESGSGPASSSADCVGSLMPGITSTGERRSASPVTLRPAYTRRPAAYRYRP